MNEYDKEYTINEVETITGIPRTKIRHYLNKELITVEKDENNGYYNYSYDDLIRLCQIAYYREILDFPVKTISALLKTSDIKVIEKIFADGEKKIKNKIINEDDKLNYIHFNQRMIEHLFRFRNKIALVPFDTFYVFPYSSYFNVDFPIFPVLYGATEFSFDGKEIKKQRCCCVAFERDLNHIDRKDVEKYCTEENVVRRDISVYTVRLTQREIDDPHLLSHTINWAGKHRFRIIDPIYSVHFFPFYKDEYSYKYVETYLPIDVR